MFLASCVMNDDEGWVAEMCVHALRKTPSSEHSVRGPVPRVQKSHDRSTHENSLIFRHESINMYDFSPNKENYNKLNILNISR